ncbi:MAG: phage tail tube protein, partial [Bacillaceae bacterium]
MPAKNTKIILEVNSGDDVTPEWVPVGGQRNATISEEVEELDLTSEDSDGVSEYAPGFSSTTIDCDGVYVPSADGYLALKQAFRNKELIRVRLKEDGLPTEQAMCFITSRELESP